ncbi:MAG: EAL domain-containing protein [Clostridia bacterium]|nr:EAL domain-containing protein [Clostridia bacterium]
MEEQKWKREVYETWDAAFKALLPQVRQQSVRVAAYARELFVKACAQSFAKHTPEGQARIHGRYADAMYKCGMYHQLGKALVPPEYQQLQPDFTEEEQQLYRKYTTDGRILVAMLQVRSAKARFWKKDNFEEQPTENIPWLMIRESCEQHMERWDGSGYPAGRTGDEISAVAQIVGLAKELDTLASTTRSENPFDEAVEQLCAQSGTAWNPELIAVLKAAKDDCRAVYQKYIHYTLTLPKTIQLVERESDRVMGLSYRPMLDSLTGDVAAYEATPWFSGILGQPGEVERMADIAPMLRRTGLIGDVCFYLLYEAADTILRMRNCKIDVTTLLVQMPDEFYALGSKLKEFTQLFEDQPIEKENLLLTISESAVVSATKATLETIAKYRRNHISLVLDNFHPEAWAPERLKELGFTHLRLAPEVCMLEETANSAQALKTWGFTILGAGVDTPEMQSWLFANGAEWVSGPVTGPSVSEDELIRDGIVRRQQ